MMPETIETAAEVLVEVPFEKLQKGDVIILRNIPSQRWQLDQKENGKWRCTRNGEYSVHSRHDHESEHLQCLVARPAPTPEPLVGSTDPDAPTQAEPVATSTPAPTAADYEYKFHPLTPSPLLDYDKLQVEDIIVANNNVYVVNHRLPVLGKKVETLWVVHDPRTFVSGFILTREHYEAEAFRLISRVRGDDKTENIPF